MKMDFSGDTRITIQPTTFQLHLAVFSVVHLNVSGSV